MKHFGDCPYNYESRDVIASTNVMKVDVNIIIGKYLYCIL